MKTGLILVSIVGLLAAGCGNDNSGTPATTTAAAGTAKPGGAGSMNASGMTPGPGTANFGSKTK